MNTTDQEICNATEKAMQESNQESRLTTDQVGDAVSYLTWCSETLGQVAAIFRSIERAASDPETPAHQITKLADAGFYIANEMENLADCWKAEVEQNGRRSN